MKKVSFVCSILIVLSMLLAPGGSVLAQDQQPPKPPRPANPLGGSDGPYSRFNAGAIQNRPSGEIEAAAVEELGLLQDKEGLWYRVSGPDEESVTAEADISAQATDSYGYTSKTLKYNWIDATGGKKLVIDIDDPIPYEPLPFDFSFYNEVYSEVGVSNYGFLQMGDWSYFRSQSPLLEPAEPNNIIAPFWAPLVPSEEWDNAGVYTLTGEDDTGRYVVFEWYNMTDGGGDTYNEDYNHFTFEVILYEDGRIIFQYDEMYYPRYGWSYCGAAGIEDWTGTVGLVTLKYCTRPKGYRGVQFTPPKAPTARVKVFPLDYGALAVPGGEAEVIFVVHNTGNLGDDTYDFTVKSKWPVTLFGEDDLGEIYPLVDNDGDRKVDTGQICNGCSFKVIVRTQVPVTAKTGNTLSGTITVASSRKTSRKVTVNVQTTVPAAFVQSYGYDWEYQTKYFSPTAGITTAETNMDGWWGYDPAVTTLPNGNIVSLWSDYSDCTEDDCHEELYYRINNSQGVFVTGNAKVQDLTGTGDMWDFDGALAAAPDGNTGIIWMHEVRGEGNSYQYNIYFAVLNADGDISYGPVDITQNTEYFSYNDYSGKRFYAPHIAATGDNRFVLTWEQDEYVEDDIYTDLYSWQENIYTTVLDTAGNVVQGITERTLDRGDTNANFYDDSSYYEPSVTQLTNNRFLLSWTGWEAKKWTRTYKVYYQVYTSDGTPVTKVTAVSTGAYSDFSLDAAQMTNGQIILAWARYTKQAWNGKPSIYYIVLNDLTYKKVKGPTALTHKAALTGSGYVSVTTDNLNHAILTWVDSNWAFGKHLYYALLGKNGAVLTKPAIALSTYDRWQGRIETNSYGYANSPYPVEPAP